AAGSCIAEATELEGLDYIALARLVTREDSVAAREAIARARRGALVIDLRRCQGSGLARMLELANCFAPSGTLVGSMKARAFLRDLKTSVDARNVLPERKRVVFLVSRFTSGSQELLVPFLEDHGNCVTVGERTAGRLVSYAFKELPSGLGVRFASEELLD